VEPQLPHLPTPDLRCKFYGESSTDDIIRKLLFAREVAHQNNEDASDIAQQQFNAQAAPHKFLLQQLVLMDEHSFLHKNQKLAPKWSGPHKIVHLKGDANVEIQLKHNNPKTVVHANRLKPYFVAYKNLAVHPDFLPASSSPQQWPDDVNPAPLPEDYTEIHRTLLPTLGEVRPTQPSPAINSQMQIPAMPRRRTRTSSTSSKASRNLDLPDDVPPAMRTNIQMLPQIPPL